MSPAVILYDNNRVVAADVGLVEDKGLLFRRSSLVLFILEKGTIQSLLLTDFLFKQSYGLKQMLAFLMPLFLLGPKEDLIDLEITLLHSYLILYHSQCNIIPVHSF